ncbi:MAG TPA: glycosyltransferase family 39 protein, partial [Chloroflexota bacterium]|nr:glycosyltransferase family 39 protein [Chloroflexota bacterium]
MSTATLVEEARQLRGLVAAALALSLAIIAQGYVAAHDYLFDGLLLYLFALALTYRFIPDIPLQSSPSPRAENAEPVRLRGRSFLVVLAFLLCWATSMLLFHSNSMLTPAWTLYALSVIGAPLSVWLATGRPRCSTAAASSSGYVVALGAVMLLAALVRFVGLGSLPFGLWWDEAYSGLQIQRLMTDPSFRPVYVGGMAQEPSLIWYLTVPFFALFGPGAVALRTAAALGGVLGVLSIYLLGGELFGRRAGIVAAALLAVMSWHLGFSRIAFNAVWSVALDGLAAYFFLRAMRTGSMVRFALAGTAMGIGANMYYTTRLLPLVLLLYLGHRLVVERTAFFRRHLRGLLLFALVVVVTAGPLIQFALQNTQEFGSRVDQVSILKEVTSRGNLQPLAENLRKHLLMFNYQGDANGRHNLPSAPMLDQVTGALFVLGLLLALRRAYRGPYFFTLAWSVVMLTGGVFSLSFEAPQGLRSIDETLAVALLAALPIVGMWEGLDRVWSGEFRLVPPRGLGHVGLPMAALPVIGLLALIGFLNYDRYFVKQASDPKSWSVFSTAETQVSREINALGSNYAVHLGPTFTSHPTIEFLTGRRGLPAFDPVAQLPLRDARGVALFLEPNQTEAISAIRRLYPQAEIRSFSPPSGGDPLLYSVVVRQPDVLRMQGMTASYYANSDWSGEPASTEQIPSTSIELGAGLPAMPFSARWESTLASPTYGRYRFKVEGPTSVNVWLDGSPLEHTNDVLEVVMAKGNHSLVISAIVTEATAIRLLWQPPNT